MVPTRRGEQIDVARARAETPGCRHVAHFNNAGAALPPRPVLDAVVSHLELEGRIGGYEAARQASQQLAHAYDAAARLLGAEPAEIAILENATRAWDMAFYAMRFEPGDRILTTRVEYASNFIALLQVAARTGVSIEVIPDDDRGATSVEALRAMIDDRVRLISVTHIPTNGGLINPAAEIGTVAREAGVIYLLDACQSVGQMPIDVGSIGCDILSVTGRKYLRGPRGTGILYVRRGLIDDLEPPFLDLHAARWTAGDRYEIRPDARRFETWESAVAARIGLGVAIDYALDWGLEPIWSRISRLAGMLRERLMTLPGIVVRDLGAKRCGIVSFTVDGCAPADVQKALGDRGINVSCSTRESTLLDMEARGLESVVRASVHYYNDEDEVDRLCSALVALQCRP